MNRPRAGDADRKAGCELLHAKLSRVAAGRMRFERGDVLLEPSMLVNEAIIRLAAGERMTWQARAGLAMNLEQHK